MPFSSVTVSMRIKKTHRFSAPIFAFECNILFYTKYQKSDFAKIYLSFLKPSRRFFQFQQYLLINKWKFLFRLSLTVNPTSVNLINNSINMDSCFFFVCSRITAAEMQSTDPGGAATSSTPVGGPNQSEGHWSNAKSWMIRWRGSRQLVLVIVAIALLLDNMLLTVVGKFKIKQNGFYDSFLFFYIVFILFNRILNRFRMVLKYIYYLFCCSVLKQPQAEISFLCYCCVLQF